MGLLERVLNHRQLDGYLKKLLVKGDPKEVGELLILPQVMVDGSTPYEIRFRFDWNDNLIIYGYTYK